MPVITITPGADIGQVKALLAENDLPYEDLTVAQMDDFLSLYEGERLVGCVGLERYDENGLLRSLVVESDYRGRGLGARLLAAIEALAISKGVGAPYLLTTTAETFFAARGYHITERSKVPEAIGSTSEFQSLCPGSAACMVKHLMA